MATVKITLTLESNKASIIRLWIDSDYRVHPYMKIHSGGMTLLWKGSIKSRSSKQKINMRRST